MSRAEDVSGPNLFPVLWINQDAVEICLDTIQTRKVHHLRHISWGNSGPCGGITYIPRYTSSQSRSRIGRRQTEVSLAQLSSKDLRHQMLLLIACSQRLLDVSSGP